MDTVQQVRKYVPVAVTCRVKPGDTKWSDSALQNIQMLAEIREVSILFIVTRNYDITAGANESVKVRVVIMSGCL
jgi:hypothetical protein